MHVSLRNNYLYSKKRRISCISPAEHDIFGMIDDKSLKTRVLASKLASFDRIRLTLLAEHKNMCVSLRNNDLFYVLGAIDDYSLKTRVLSKLVSIDTIR